MRKTPNHPHLFGVPAIMDQGYYVDLFRKHEGLGLVAHFFEPAVLDRFRNDPNYKVADTMVSTKYDATTEPSCIQQYVWGRRTDGEPCIAVLLRHLRFLSARDQLHWQAHELPPHEASAAKIEARYMGPMLHGDFLDTVSYYQAIFLYLTEIQKVFNPDRLLPNLPDEPPTSLAPLPYNTKKAMASFAQDLFSLLNMSLTVLTQHLSLATSQAKAADLLKQQQSRNLIKLYFEDHGQFSKEIEETLDVLRDLNDWRVQGAQVGSSETGPGLPSGAIPACGPLAARTQGDAAGLHSG